jgi:hypothetical protein
VNGYYIRKVKVSIPEQAEMIETGNTYRTLVVKHAGNKSPEKLRRKKLNLTFEEHDM